MAILLIAQGVYCLQYKAATRDVTSVMKSLRGAKQYGLPMEREHFRYCMSVKALVNATMIVGACKCHYDSRREEGEYYERSISTASS